MLERLTEVNLETPGQTYGDVTLEFLSEEGNGGVQGFVRPARITGEGLDKVVQVKEFYKTSVDDNGEPFTQVPEDEVRKSYDNLKDFGEKGFRVPAYFGKAQKNDTHLLVLEDLTGGGEIEVHDEKAYHRDRDTHFLLTDMENWRDVCLQLNIHGLLQQKYHFGSGFSNGDKHMFTRDPKTNRGDVFMVDIGQFMVEGWLSRNAEETLSPEDFEPTKPLDVFEGLIGDRHLAGDLFAEAREKDRLRMEYMQLSQESITSKIFWTLGVFPDQLTRFAMRNYRKKGFDPGTIEMKRKVDSNSRSYESLRGSSLYDWNAESESAFREALISRDLVGLMNGIGYAHLVALDRDFSYLGKVFHEGRVFDRADLSNQVEKFTLLEDYDDIEKNPVLQLFCESSGYGPNDRGVNRMMDLAVSWETGYDAAKWGSHPYFIYPGEIRALYTYERTDKWPHFEQTPILDFDPDNVRVILDPIGCIHYMHEDLEFHTVYYDTRVKEGEGPQLPPLNELRKRGVEVRKS